MAKSQPTARNPGGKQAPQRHALTSMWAFGWRFFLPGPVAVVVAYDLAAQRTSSGSEFAWRVVWEIMALALAIRAARLRLRIDDDGILVRNVLRTHRIPWSDVERIGWRFVFGFKYSEAPGLALGLRSGRTITATASAGMGSRGIDDLLAALTPRAASRRIPMAVTADDLAHWKRKPNAVRPSKPLGVKPATAADWLRLVLVLVAQVPGAAAQTVHDDTIGWIMFALSAALIGGSLVWDDVANRRWKP